MRYELIPLAGGDSIRVVKTEIIVGRIASSCDLYLDMPSISQKHARLSWKRGDLAVEDLQSTNGTWVNGVRVDRAKLTIGDVIAFATCTFRVEMQSTNEDDLESADAPAANQVQDNSLSSEIASMLAQAEPAANQVQDNSLSSEIASMLAQAEPAANQVQDTSLSSEIASMLAQAEPAMVDTPPKKTPVKTVRATFQSNEPTPAKDSEVEAIRHMVGVVNQSSEPTRAKDSERPTSPPVPQPTLNVQLANAPSVASLDNAAPLSAVTHSPAETARESPTHVSDDDAPKTEVALRPSTATPVGSAWIPPQVDQPSFKRPPQRWTSGKDFDEPATGWRSITWWFRGRGESWVSSPGVATATVLALLSVWWLWYGGGDGPAIELCQRIKNELVERRDQGKTSGPEWEEFRHASESQLKDLVKKLQTSVDARQPQRQALLWAARDELLVMLTRDQHRQRELSHQARQLEESFDRHIQIARGELSWNEAVATTHGVRPSGR